ASFRQNVRVVQHGTGDSPLSMNAENMDLTYTGTNELQSLTADGGVFLSQEEFQLRSDKMAYEAATALARFTGKPKWELGPRQGRGDLIEINTAAQQMRVAGNAWMQLPAGEF